MGELHENSCDFVPSHDSGEGFRNRVTYGVHSELDFPWFILSQHQTPPSHVNCSLVCLRCLIKTSRILLTILLTTVPRKADPNIHNIPPPPQEGRKPPPDPPPPPPPPPEGVTSEYGQCAGGPYRTLLECILVQQIYIHISIGSSGRVGGGPRNMKSMWPPLAAIFFMTSFYRTRGGHGPLAPPPPLDPLLHMNILVQAQVG